MPGIALKCAHRVRRKLACFSTSLSIESSVRRHLVQLIRGAGIAQLITIGSTPIVSRLYTPEQFGTYGLFATFVGVGAVFATAKYDFAIVSAKTAREAKQLLLGCLAISIAVAAVIAALMLSCRSTKMFGLQTVPVAAIAMLGPTVLLTAMFLTLRQWAVRQTKYVTLSNSLIGQSGGRCAAQVGLGIVGAGWAGLLAAELVGRAIACAVCAQKMWPDLQGSFRRRELVRVTRALHRNRRFPLYCLPSTLVDTVALLTPGPLVIYFYGMATGGAFVLIRRVLTLPMNFFGSSISDVFHKQLAICATRSDGSALRLLDRTAYRLLLIGTPPAVLLAISGKWITPWVLGPRWEASGAMAAVMAPWMLAQFVVSPISHTMSVYRSHHVKLIYDAANLIATIISVSIVASYQGNYLLATQALSWSNVAAYVLFYFLMRHVVASKPVLRCSGDPKNSTSSNEVHPQRTAA